MAKKKPIPIEEEQQQGISPENAQMLEEMQQMEQQDQILKMANHEANNKEHSPEFSEFSDYNGVNDEQDNLHVIGTEEIQKAYHTLMKYKEEKASLEQKIAENEKFWRLNHWEVVPNNGQQEADKRIKPKSAWLFNMIINKHADAMDNYPQANVLPRAKDDEEAAEALSEIIPVILEWNDYEKTYSDCQWYKAKQGTSVQSVMWNNDLQNGLGDIEIKKVDLLNLFWKGGVKDIQDSPNVFLVEMFDNEQLKSQYPELKLGGSNSLGITSVESYEENVDTSNQTAVVDWYYRRKVQEIDDLGVKKTRTVLHYCKFSNEQVLYASENDPKYAERGWYDHGKYPFVFDTLFPVESSIVGMGFIDVEKDDQMYIDKLNQAILESAIVNARPRYFVRGESTVNEQEFTDLSKVLIHAEDLGQNSLLPVGNTPFNSVYENIYLNRIQEMKDTSGNTASSQGQSSNVTSASGIASLQEAAGKLSRDSNNTSYRAYKQVVDLVIELIRQFYDIPRCFRIVGDFGHNEYIQFDNSGLVPQEQGQAFGVDLGSRMPIMDIDVKPQKNNAYSKDAQNQTALNLYSLGFFNPQNADSAMACLDMMDFDDIETVRENVSKNGTLLQMVQQLQQQLMQMAAALDAQNGTNLAQGVMQEAQVQNNVAMGGNMASGGNIETSKGSLSTQAADATRGSTSPE